MYFQNICCSFTRGKVPETPVFTYIYIYILIFVQNLNFKNKKTALTPRTCHVWPSHNKHNASAAQRQTHMTGEQGRNGREALTLNVQSKKDRNDAWTLSEKCVFTCCDGGSGPRSPDRPKSCSSGSVLSSAGAAPLASLS